jgi:hypothetical protein
MTICGSAGDGDTHLMVCLVCNNAHTHAVNVQYLGNKHEHHVSGMRKEPSFFPVEGGLATPLPLLQAKIGRASTLSRREKRDKDGGKICILCRHCLGFQGFP